MFENLKSYMVTKKYDIRTVKPNKILFVYEANKKYFEGRNKKVKSQKSKVEKLEVESRI